MKKKKQKPLQDLHFEISFYERLISEKEEFVDALMPLADAYTRAGLFKKGLEIDEKLARLRPNDDGVCYNLACSYSLLGALDKAFEALERSFRLGYRDLYHLQKDKDLDNLRNDSRFQQLVARYFSGK